MFRTSVLVSVLALVTAIFAGGVVAADQVSGSTPAETATATQQQLVEAEVIVEDRNGDRLSDIEVVAQWDNGSASDTTTSQGRVLLDVPANQTVEFTVTDTDGEFVRNHQPRRVQPGNLARPVTIQMAPRGQIEFTVVDSNDQPLEDARLRLSHTDGLRTVDTVFTDASGDAVVSGVEQRTYSVRVIRAGYNRTTASVELDSSSTTSTIEIERHTVNVDFTVVDDHFQQPRPLEGVTIEIPKLGGSPIPTDESGQTQARLPVNDDYELTVRLDGYQETTTTLSLGQASTAVQLQTQRDPSISINQLQNAIVVGQPTQVTVTNAYDEPVRNALVSLNGDTVGQTDRQGQIVFEITQAGNNTIEANANGLSASTTLRGVDPNAAGDDTADEGETGDGSEGDDTADESNDGDGSESNNGDNSDSGSADAIGPGFGVVVALVGLATATLLARRAG